jgi:hypothetical protein
MKPKTNSVCTAIPNEKAGFPPDVVKTKIYLGERNVSVRTALRLLHDDYIDDGGYCAATVIGLRDALKEAIAMLNRRNHERAAGVALKPCEGSGAGSASVAVSDKAAPGGTP